MSRRPSPPATAPPERRTKSSRHLTVGRLGGAFGVRGELLCAPTRLGDDALTPGRRVFVTLADGTQTSDTIVATRRHHGKVLLSLAGVADATRAAQLRGATLLVERSELTLGANEYFDEDLVGAALVDEAGTALGTVSDVKHFPAQDCLVVTPGNGFVPLVREFVRDIDVERRRIVVALPDGLLDPARAEEG